MNDNNQFRDIFEKLNIKRGEDRILNRHIKEYILFHNDINEDDLKKIDLYNQMIFNTKRRNKYLKHKSNKVSPVVIKEDNIDNKPIEKVVDKLIDNISKDTIVKDNLSAINNIVKINELKQPEKKIISLNSLLNNNNKKRK